MHSVAFGLTKWSDCTCSLNVYDFKYLCSAHICLFIIKVIDIKFIALHCIYAFFMHLFDFDLNQILISVIARKPRAICRNINRCRPNNTAGFMNFAWNSLFYDKF